jgi:hypothetical protein
LASKWFITSYLCFRGRPLVKSGSVPCLNNDSCDNLVTAEDALLVVTSNGDTGTTPQKFLELVRGDDIGGSGSTYSHFPTDALQNQ